MKSIRVQKESLQLVEGLLKGAKPGFYVCEGDARVDGPFTSAVATKSLDEYAGKEKLSVKELGADGKFVTAKA